jgi:Tol biopolymer transport system component
MSWPRWRFVGVFALLVALGAFSFIVKIAQELRAEDNLARDRRILIFQFTASAEAFAFPTPVLGAEIAIYFADRKTGKRQLVGETGMTLAYPSFSRDGTRLLVVRRRSSGELQQLLSCAIGTWQCRRLFETEDRIMSPTELPDGSVLFSSSPLAEGADGRKRYSRNDLYLLSRDGTAPRRLTNFALSVLGPLSTDGRTILFTGVDGSGKILPRPASVGTAQSEIYSLEFDRAQRIKTLTEILTPGYKIEGFSTHPAISEDGGTVAFVNRRAYPGGSRFNVVIARRNGDPVAYHQASDFGFSQPAFVGSDAYANELLMGRYVIRTFADPAQPSILVEQSYAPDVMKKLETIAITVLH